MKPMPTLFAAGLIAVATLNTAQARDFIIVGWCGVAQDRQRELYFAPFAQQDGARRELELSWGGAELDLGMLCADGFKPLLDLGR